MEQISARNISSSKKNIYYGQVIDNSDITDSGIIKVREKTLDQSVDDSDLPLCYPLFNFQFFHILPKKGERVLLLLERSYEGQANQEKRYWAAISMSNSLNIEYDSFYFNAGSHESNGWLKNTPIKQNPLAKGVFNDSQDLSIQGRTNTDITFKPRQLILRSGRHILEKNDVFNTDGQSYIDIKYKQFLTKSINEKGEIKTTLIPSEYDFYVSKNQNNSILIKVLDKRKDVIVESISSNYENLSDAIFGIKQHLESLKTKYPKWEIKTTIPELSSINRIFPNNIERKRVKDNKVKQETELIDPTINLVSSNLNFISNNTVQVDVNKQPDLIDLEVQKILNTSGDRMVKGDALLELLGLFILYFNNHKHGYHNLPAVQDLILEKINSFDLESILHDNIRIH